MLNYLITSTIKNSIYFQLSEMSEFYFQLLDFVHEKVTWKSSVL